VNHASLIVVTPEANDRYFAEVLRRRGRQVFWPQSCSLANSYYFDHHGDVRFDPAPTLETMWRGRHYPLSSYRLQTLAAAGVPAGSQNGLHSSELSVARTTN
jgi:hypothetical protein